MSKTMNKTSENVIPVPLDTFENGVTAMAKLDSIRALICSEKEYCSDAIKIILEIPINKEEPDHIKEEREDK